MDVQKKEDLQENNVFTGCVKVTAKEALEEPAQYRNKVLF